MSQMIETKISTAKKVITSQVRRQLEVLKELLDGIENWVQDRFPFTSETVTGELKAQLADMRSQIANFSMQPV